VDPFRRYSRPQTVHRDVEHAHQLLRLEALVDHAPKVRHGGDRPEAQAHQGREQIAPHLVVRRCRNGAGQPQRNGECANCLTGCNTTIHG